MENLLKKIEPKTTKSYDWIVIGAGICGVTVSEILSRAGHKVLIIDSKAKICSDTSRIFHEWLHTGALYTLSGDKLDTTRNLLSAINDLLAFYKNYPKNNLFRTESGLTVKGQGWINKEPIKYYYRIRKFNISWLFKVSKSINLIKKLCSHDWLRNNPGDCYGYTRLSRKSRFSNLFKLLKSKKKFLEITTPDLTFNSYKLVEDILMSAINNGLHISLNNEVKKIEEKEKNIIVKTLKKEFACKRCIICTPKLIAKNFSLNIKTSFAPMAVVKGVAEEQSSYVQLDSVESNCINLINKKNGNALIGGSSFATIEQANNNLQKIINQHKKLNKKLKVVGTYIGEKRELQKPNLKRNYLYHINHHTKKISSIVLGKYTLAFTAAAEFYRQIYHDNPPMNVNYENKFDLSPILAEPFWRCMLKEQNNK